MRWFLAASLVATVAACSKKSPDAGDDRPKPIEASRTGSGSGSDPGSGSGSGSAAAVAGSGWYRAVIGEKQGTAIPFFLQLPATGDDAWIASGGDRVRAHLVSRAPKVVVAFDILHTQIDATAGDGGALDGQWASSSKTWGSAALSFQATPIAGPDPALRFPASASTIDPVGIYKVALMKPDETGQLSIRRGAAPNELLATFAFQGGNMAFVAGNQDGRTIRLSAFDGSSPYLLVGELDDTGKTLTGNWTAGQELAWKQDFKATKTGDFDFQRVTHLASARPKLKLPLLAKEPYKGNPVIVELGGSWCPACGNAAAKLRELQTKYAADGLKVVTLAYEFTDDATYNKEEAELFKKKFGMTWDVIPIDGSLEKYNDILPKELELIDASGFPLTLFVARDGGIEGFHNGFPAAEWGDVRARAIADYERLAAKIVGR